jgi:hypothetical protein
MIKFKWEKHYLHLQQHVESNGVNNKKMKTYAVTGKLGTAHVHAPMRRRNEADR